MPSGAEIRDKLRTFLKSSTVKAQFGGKIKKLFNALDVDRDGRITQDEMRKSLSVIGLELSPSDVEKLFQELDIDNDNRVDFNEVHKFLHHVTIIEPAKKEPPPKVMATGKGAVLRNQLRGYEQGEAGFDGIAGLGRRNVTANPAQQQALLATLNVSRFTMCLNSMKDTHAGQGGRLELNSGPLDAMS